MEFKTISSGKMVSDFDIAALPPNYYPPNAFNLKNGRFKGRVGSSGGNTQLPWNTPSGTNVAICSCVDEEDKLIYHLNYNSAGNHTVVETSTVTGATDVIFQNLIDSTTDLFGFTADTDVSSMKVIDGGDVDEYGNKVSKVLVWTDSTTEIRYLNIGKTRRYVFTGTAAVVNTSGVCTLSHSAILPSDTLRYVFLSGAWFRVKSAIDGSLVINGTVADGSYPDVIWSYRDVIDMDETVLIKSPPSFPVQAEYQSDPTIIFNNLRGDIFQFIHAYVYDDNEQSAWSVTSKITIPQSDFTADDLTSLIDNSMLVSVHTGPKGVKGIKIAFRKMISSPNNYSQLQYIDKRKLGIDDNIVYNLNFLNNEAYIPVAVAEVSNLDHDYIPRRTGCLEVVNNGSLVFGDVTDGYNQEGVDMSTTIFTEEFPALTSTLWAGFRDFGGAPGSPIEITISGTVYPGDTLRIQTSEAPPGGGSLTSLMDTTLTVGSLETFNDFAHRVVAQIFFYSTTSSTYPTDLANYVISDNNNNLTSGSTLHIDALTVGHTSSTAIDISSLSLKTGSAYKLGVVYGDHYGRKSPVQYNNGGYFKTLDFYNLGGLFQGVQWQINSQPPKWAEWYAIVATKNLTHLNTYYGVAETMSIDSTKPNLVSVCIENMNDLFLDNGVNFVNYNFAKNDRMRFLSPQPGSPYVTNVDGEILADTTQTIGGVSKRVLSVRFPSGFSTSIFTSVSGTVSTCPTAILFEAYSPKKLSDSDNVFYHIGEVFPVLNPGTDTRYHSADVQDQTSSLPALGKITGIDCFMKPRLLPLTEHDPLMHPVTVEDFNSSDWYPSAFTSIGTPTIVDPSYREVRRKATLIHTDPFVPETNINGLNRSYPGYFKDYDLTMGAFRWLNNKGAYIQAVHESDSQRIPINATIISTASGATQIGLSSDLLNQGVNYAGGYGLGNNSSAVIDTGNYVYMIDGNRGCFVRLGLDGFDDIGLEAGLSTWIHDTCNNYNGISNKIKIGYDPFDKEVIIAFQQSGSIDPITLAYAEKNQGFSTLYSFMPECLQNFGSKFYTFNGGVAWVHDYLSSNTWYGANYPTTFDVVFNDAYPNIKICRFIKVFSNLLVTPVSIATDTGGATTMIDSMFDVEVSTDYTKSLVTTNVDGIFVAAVPMDANSPGGIYDGLPLRGRVITVSCSANQSTLEYDIQGLFLGYSKV